MSLGFIGGLGAAMEGYTAASKDWENRQLKQAEEQRRADDHAYNQQLQQQTLDKLARIEQERVDTVNAAKPLEIQPTEETLGADVMGPPATNYKVGDQTFTDESKAKAYATDPYEAAKRAADVKLKYGDVDGSLSIGQKLISSRMDGFKFADATRAQEAAVINDTMTKRLFDPKGDLWGNGASILSELDKNGNTYKAEKQANGTIVMNKYASDGTPLGQHGSAFPDTYEGQRAFAGGFMNAPTWKEKSDQLGAWAKAQHEARKEELKMRVDESIIKKNTNQAEGTGGYAKEPKPDAISEGFKNWNPKDMPTARADGERIARQAKDLNPGATDQDLIYAAQAVVVEGPDSPNIKPRLDFSTGKPTAVFTDPRTGKQTKLYPTQPKPEMAAALQADVATYIAQQNAQMPGKGDLLKQAAANPRNQLFMEKLLRTEADSIYPAYKANKLQEWRQTNEQRQRNGLPPDPQPSDALLSQQVRDMVMSPQYRAKINGSLQLINTYGAK